MFAFFMNQLNKNKMPIIDSIMNKSTSMDNIRLTHFKISRSTPILVIGVLSQSSITLGYKFGAKHDDNSPSISFLSIIFEKN